MLKLLVAASMMTFLTTLQAGEDEGNEPEDFSVCTSCDVASDEDEEVRKMAELISETRWQMSATDSGFMTIQNQSDMSKHRWHWRSDEGELNQLKSAEETDS